MAKRMVSYRHTLVNSAGTFISRITGLIRQQIINHFFGAGADTFISAFNIPNTIRRNVGEGALSNSFIPVYQKALAEGDGQASRFASTILNIFLLVTTVISAAGIALAPLYFPLLVPGFRERSVNISEGVTLVMIMMPFVIFISLFSIVMGILNSHKRFTSPAFAPILWNVFIILLPIFFVRQLGIYTLGIGVAAGGLSMFLAELFELRGTGFRYHFTIEWKNPLLRDFGALFFPTSVNMLLLTVKDLVSIVFVSFFAGGMLARLNAYTIIEAPLGIIGLAIGTVLLPLLSRFKVDANWEGFEKALDEAFHMLSYLTLPVFAFLLAFPDTVVNVLFRDTMGLITGNTGRMTSEVLALCYQATAIYALALFPMSCIYIFERIFYSVHDGKTLLIGNIITVAASVSLYFTAFIPGAGLAGVIAAEAAASWIVFFFYFGFRLKKYVKPSSIIRALGGKFAVMVLAAAAGVGAALPFHHFIYLKFSSPLYSILLGGAEFLIFAAVYFAITAIFRAGLRR